MILILDGYNILKQVLSTSRITQTERDAFIRCMGKYAHKKNHKVIIFFDGGPYEKPYESRLNGVAVWYAGHHITADELIIQHSTAYKNKDAALITSDNELITKTSPSIKTVFEPQFFYTQVKSTLQSPSSLPNDLIIIKTSEEQNDELDALMREAASLQSLYKDKTPQSSLIPTKDTLSKKERSIQKHKKKL